MGGQVVHCAETAIALAEHGPWLVVADELAPDQLGILHDAVGAEMHQIIGLRARIAAPDEGLRQHHAATAVAARIEQQHVIVIERAFDPAGAGERSRSGEPGPSLKENHPRPD